MFIMWTKRKQGSKVYRYPFLAESFREDGKSKHRILLNLSSWSPEMVDALETSIKSVKKGKKPINISSEDIDVGTGKSIGAIYTAMKLSKRLKIKSVLGSSRQGSLALLMIFARLIHPSSKLANVRWANLQEDILGVDSLNEDQLYSTLDWLEENQVSLEKKLFKKRYNGIEPPGLFLYDVTSSYLEGNKNELSAWGYNRDGKKGKKQIVIGLLGDPDGMPVAVRVFDGNRSDTTTFSEQIRTVADEFGISDVTFVGDKGMIKGPQIEEITDRKFHYITSISKPQIRKMLSEGLIQMDLFDEKITEVEDDNGIRYILRCNPQRRTEVRSNRQDRIDKILETAVTKNEYLAESSNRQPDAALKYVINNIKKYKLSKILTAELTDRTITVKVDNEKLAEVELLDGCYVIKTDLKKNELDAQKVHDRYKDLAKVESAFKRIKSELEIRPLNHRLERRTKAHVFVCMLAYMIEKEFENLTVKIDGTLSDKWYVLDHHMTSIVKIGNFVIKKCNKPNDKMKELYEALKIVPPVLKSEKPDICIHEF